MRKSLNLLGLSVTMTLGIMAVAPDPVQAGTLYNNWNYAIDSFNDSTYRRYSGGSTYVGGGDFEIYGMAVKDDVANNRISIAINSNLGAGGAWVPFGSGYGHIGWGDVFFQTSQGLFGARFNSQNGATGIYANVTGRSVTSWHDGWPTNSSYANYVRYRGGNPTLGDLRQDQFLFGNSTNNVINSGHWIGGLGAADFSGLDFGRFGVRGTNTFGFSFSKSLLPTGNLITTVLQECFNDGIALVSQLSSPPPPEPPHPPQPPQPTVVKRPVITVIDEPVVADVPEPASLLGLTLLGALGALGATKQKRVAKSSMA
jgi:hypothetical protein